MRSGHAGSAVSWHAERFLPFRIVPPAMHERMRGIFERAEACARAGDNAGAARHYRQILASMPLHAGAHHNLGNVLLRQCRYAEAERHYRTAISLDPEFAPAHFALGGILLCGGDLKAGFAEMEWRFQLPGRERRFPAPRWHGQPLNGTPVLVNAEQGYGDTLQMLRYLSLIAERGGKPLFAGPPALHRLIATMPGVRVVGGYGELPAQFLECPMMSLPLAFGTTLATIPAPGGYLSADPAPWGDVLAGMSGLKVGLCWAGKSWAEQPHVVAIDKQRSMRLTDMLPLLDVPGCSFVSLQLGPPAAQMQQAGDVPLLDVSARLTDWAATAGLISGLDLVITVDTAIVHLAAALGRPVWMLDRAVDHCWRWLRDRSDSPWYSSLRIFRQVRQNDWSKVINDVVKALRDEAGCVSEKGKS